MKLKIKPVTNFLPAGLAPPNPPTGGEGDAGRRQHHKYKIPQSIDLAGFVRYPVASVSVRVKVSFETLAGKNRRQWA
ncbi:MAG: hypothetical protein NTZ85_06285 [Bacteroidia bacterium]|nr:hypothetical protein [Bacteroidia bacterium]